VTGNIEAAQVAEAVPPALPATGSPLPLLALLGVLFVGAGSLLERYRR
jgi:LPXTG-motif cell wall-anchored protein